MKNRMRMMLVGAVVLVTCGFAVATAQASRSISSSASTIGASGSLTLNNDREICDVLIELRLTANPIPKTTTTAFATAGPGYIRNCIGPVAAAAPNNTGTILAGTTVRYASFTGTLPSALSAINISSDNAGFSINTLAGQCLFRASTTNPLTGLSLTVSSSTITAARFTNDGIDRASGSILCPASGAINGTLTVLGTAPRITLL